MKSAATLILLLLGAVVCAFFGWRSWPSERVKAGTRRLRIFGASLLHLVALVLLIAFAWLLTAKIFPGVIAFDRLMLDVELAVVILIGAEMFGSVLLRRREQRRQAILNEIIRTMGTLMDEGLRLQSIVPDPQVAREIPRTSWGGDVNRWTEETNAFLAQHSQRASQAFMLVTDAAHADSIVYSEGRQFALTGSLREFYQQFAVRLTNLRRIMERPEAYF